MQALIIDDHPLIFQALSHVICDLQPDMRVHTACTARAGIVYACEHKPDLILLDLGLPDLGGFDVLQTLGRRLPATPVVIISASLRKLDMHAAMAQGAAGYLPKTVGRDTIRRALSIVLAGGVYLPPQILRTGESIGARKPRQAAIALTPRQLEVLHLLNKGKSNKEIARELSCAETTVKAHIGAILRELKASNRTEAVINAHRLGVLAEE